jgi:sugar/nucleoside kinase (ribokinase family)
VSILVVGSVAIDDVTTPFGRGTGVLGGSASYFSLAASLFAPVRVVAVIGDDFPDEHLRRLARPNVSMEGLARRPGSSFFWSGSYGIDLKQATTHETRLGVFAEFAPELSAADRSCPVLFLANIDPVLQGRVLDQASGAALVILDTMNYWITNARDPLERVLGRIHVLVVNDEELRLLTGEQSVLRASRRILERGPRAVIVKQGAYGALIRTVDDLFVCPAYPTEHVVDPTGAGDTFAGGFVGSLASSSDRDRSAYRRAVVRGSALASFAVESFSVDRLSAITHRDLEDRTDALHRLVEHPR